MGIAAPDPTGRQLGQLEAGRTLEILGSRKGWHEIRHNGGTAFVAAAYVDLRDRKPRRTGVTEKRPHAKPRKREENQKKGKPGTAPEGERLLSVDGTSEERAVALAWNRWGGLPERPAKEHGIEPASAVAVLCVESAGKGFEPSNDDRLIVRFENHKFWTFWGVKEIDRFWDHFSCSGLQPWRDHEWRREKAMPWQSFHGNQRTEWEVLAFARSLDDEAALKSTSMGAPQIMGFNHEAIGYASAAEMFAAFQRGIEPQIRGLFDFLSQPMKQCLKIQAFTAFAYGQRIQRHYEAFKRVC